jgi:hypothetical protein
MSAFKTIAQQKTKGVLRLPGQPIYPPCWGCTSAGAWLQDCPSWCPAPPPPPKPNVNKFQWRPFTRTTLYTEENFGNIFAKYPNWESPIRLQGISDSLLGPTSRPPWSLPVLSFSLQDGESDPFYFCTSRSRCKCPPHISPKHLCYVPSYRIHGIGLSPSNIKWALEQAANNKTSNGRWQLNVSIYFGQNHPSRFVDTRSAHIGCQRRSYDRNGVPRQCYDLIAGYTQPSIYCREWGLNLGRFHIIKGTPPIGTPALISTYNAIKISNAGSPEVNGTYYKLQTLAINNPYTEWVKFHDNPLIQTTPVSISINKINNILYKWVIRSGKDIFYETIHLRMNDYQEPIEPWQITSNNWSVVGKGRSPLPTFSPAEVLNPPIVVPPTLPPTIPPSITPPPPPPQPEIITHKFISKDTPKSTSRRRAIPVGSLTDYSYIGRAISEIECPQIGKALKVKYSCILTVGNLSVTAYLEAPDGQKITIVGNNSSDNRTGRIIRTDQEIGQFMNKETHGVWKLVLSSNSFGGTARLESWSLTIETPKVIVK